uniref:Calcineurin-like phosphoesterase domain-containing protein n=1 Tax=Acrobeloides nanus TaxID=290746 RepID=A0A914DN30_9BILA
MAPIVVDPEPFSNDPDRLWKEWFATGKRICKKIAEPVKFDEPIYENKVRFVCISDTHEKLRELLPNIPNGDVLIHCGDFTNTCDQNELDEFNDAIGKLPHTHKIVVAGNHELGFDETEDQSLRDEQFQNHGTKEGYKLLTNCTVLHDKMVEIYGIKIYGSSWHSLEKFPYFKPRNQILKKWNLIPEGVDILLTHTPPLGHGDFWKGQCRYGDVDLLNTIEHRVKPKFHVFGHIHEETGVTTNGETIFVNAAICNHDLDKLKGLPILFDVPLKTGFKKS